MKISGFTIIKNAEIMGYPLAESLLSLIPLVDELIIGIGPSDDNTEQLIKNIGSDKIKIFHAEWDKNKTTGGLLLSEKTNEALKKCSFDWCIYLQADEVIHENDLENIKKQMLKYENDKDVDGLLFDYVHFYGSYGVIATNKKWYRKEIRAFKKSSEAFSYKDAQGFRKLNNVKLNTAPAHAKIYHYGHVKPPQVMAQKLKLFDRLWHGSKHDNKYSNFNFEKQFGLIYFLGTHPKVMHKLVNSQDWSFDPKLKLTDWSLKDLNLFLNWLFESIFGFRLGEYKPYKLLKSKS